jgi:enoyl-CoA hydratase/carnithine racemase
MTHDAFETILLDREGGIATLTLNRPDRMNAWNGQMMRDMIAAFDITDADDDVKAVIVTGSGDRAFCAGADLGAGGSTFDRDAQRARGEAAQTDDDYMRDGGGRLTLRIFDSMKPVISACNGAAVGIGATMQLAMDIRLASTTARYGFVFNKRGITPEACSSWFLPRLVGVQQALEWIYTGRVFNAQEALAGGLIRSIHDPHDLMPAARALAQEMIDNTAPVSNAMARHLMWKMMGADHPMEAHKIDSRSIAQRGQQADVKEGIQAFMEKRPARFPNKVSTDMPAVYPWWTPRKFE